jgi:hypothetical protein
VSFRLCSRSVVLARNGASPVALAWVCGFGEGISTMDLPLSAARETDSGAGRQGVRIQMLTDSRIRRLQFVALGVMTR